MILVSQDRRIGVRSTEVRAISGKGGEITGGDNHDLAWARRVVPVAADRHERGCPGWPGGRGVLPVARRERRRATGDLARERPGRSRAGRGRGDRPGGVRAAVRRVSWDRSASLPGRTARRPRWQRRRVAGLRSRATRRDNELRDASLTGQELDGVTNELPVLIRRHDRAGNQAEQLRRSILIGWSAVAAGKQRVIDPGRERLAHAAQARVTSSLLAIASHQEMQHECLAGTTRLRSDRGESASRVELPARGAAKGRLSSKQARKASAPRSSLSLGWPFAGSQRWLTTVLAAAD